MTSLLSRFREALHRQPVPEEPPKPPLSSEATLLEVEQVLAELEAMEITAEVQRMEAGKP